MKQFTLIIPYYRSPVMLMKQINTVNQYPEEFDIIVVDDCSPEPAQDIITENDNVSLYRIDDDIPWNREGARNLGSHLAETRWIIHVDTDHILPVQCAKNLCKAHIFDRFWYRFPRFRVGKADDTRKKDSIPDEQEYGPIKPHIDSYLCTKLQYWEVGGYNEEYSGCLGGGGPFLKAMKNVHGEPLILSDGIHLEVYTRSEVQDASVWDLSRDKTEFKRRKKIFGSTRPKECLKFKWHKIQ